MRLLSNAALASALVALAAAAGAQAPVYVAASRVAAPRADRPAVRPASPASAPHARADRTVQRVEVGVTAAWPSGAAAFADYEAHEIEAGTVAGDLFVRWYAFDAHPQTFAVEVAREGRPFEAVAVVAAAAPDAEYGVRLVGLVPGLYAVRMRERAAGGTAVVSAPVHVRVGPGL